jgi:hypothetical protein
MIPQITCNHNYIVFDQYWQQCSICGNIKPTMEYTQVVPFINMMKQCDCKRKYEYTAGHLCDGNCK